MNWRLLCLGPALLGTACVAGPYNDTEMPSTASTVPFRGYALYPGDVITIQASASPNGPFTTVATTTTQSNGYTYPDGVTLFYFGIDLVVPDALWSGDACTGRQTYLRAEDSVGHLLPSLDEVSPTGESPYTCIQNKTRQGTGTLVAILQCDSPDSPRVRLYTAASTGPTTFTGNVTVATPIDEKYWACLEALNGDLTVPAIGPDDLALPRLQSVSGDVTVAYDRYAIGGDNSQQGSNRLVAPQLTTITGDLVATSPLPSNGPSQPYGAVLLGLDALTTVQGDLRLQVDAANIFVNGLAALVAVGGDVIVDGGTGDASLGLLAPNLNQIAGDLEVDVGNNVFALFVDLQSVQGSFRHLGGNPAATGAATDAYRNLQTVAGALVLQDGTLQGPGTVSWLPNLSAIGGPLEYRRVAGQSAVRIGAWPGLSVGSLVIDDNPALLQLGANGVQVQSTGAIAVTNNPNLCVSTVNAFIAGQAGWTGTLTQLGNDSGC